jgi:hypothetical protein
MTSVITLGIKDPLQFLSLSIDMALLVIVSFSEHIQSILIAVLLSILISHHSGTRFDSPLWTVPIFWAIQLLSLILVLLVEGWLSSLWIGSQSLGPNWYAALSPMSISLLVFHLSRMSLIAVLWKRLNNQWGDHTQIGPDPGIPDGGPTF